MKTIQIRNVPDDLHRALQARAAQEGSTLSDYVLGELARLADKPPTDHMLARIRQRSPVGGPPVADLIREQRDKR
jgi:antitoxin FitA